MEKRARLLLVAKGKCSRRCEDPESVTQFRVFPVIQLNRVHMVEAILDKINFKVDVLGYLYVVKL